MADVSTDLFIDQFMIPTQFRSKRWIFVVQAIFIGCFSLFCLILGPLFLAGQMKNAKGETPTDAGVALTVIGVPMMLIFALAVYNLQARRRPLLRICREGLEYAMIGSSSLDRISLIPPMLRLVWLILSTEGFRKKIIRLPWEQYHWADVTGPPMQQSLTIYGATAPDLEQNMSDTPVNVRKIVIEKHILATNLDEIRYVIK